MNNHAFSNPGHGNFKNSSQGNSQGSSSHPNNHQRTPQHNGGFANNAPSQYMHSNGGAGYTPDNQPQSGVGQQFGFQAGNNYQGRSVPQGNAETRGDEDRDYRMIAAYGKRSALQFKPTGTRVSDSRKFSHQTIMIEGAMRVDPNNPQNRAYNWGDKINVQVTAGELPLVIGVLLGMAPSCHFGNHGKNNDKAFNLEFQQDKFFVSVMQKDKNAVGVAVPLVDAMQIGHLALSQYLCNYPGLDSETAMRDISRLCNQLNQANKFPLKPSK